MPDLRNPKLIYLKGILFVIIGILAIVGILLDSPTLRTAIYLVIAIWSFCRVYYFAFYVIEHYVDPGYKFAGLVDFTKYLMGKRGSGMTRGQGEKGVTSVTTKGTSRPPSWPVD